MSISGSKHFNPNVTPLPGVQTAFSFLMTKKKRESLPETFYDYKQMRDAKPRAQVAHLLITGAVFIALAAAALAVYSQYEPVL